MKVAVLGGGPSGAFAAEKLASAGVRTVLIDEKLAWEKPCGGGLTYKAYHEYPFLIHNDTPKKIVSETILAAPKAGSVSLNLRDPLVIYSRYDLNHMLLCRAGNAGAQIEKTRVTEMARCRAEAGSCAPRPAVSTPISACWPPARAIPCAAPAPGCDRTTPCRRSAISCRARARRSTFSSWKIWKAISGCSRGPATFRLGSAVRAYRPPTCASGSSSIWRSTASSAKARRSTATCCRAWKRPPGSTTGLPAMAGWRSGTPRDWSIRSPAKDSTMPCGPPTSRRARLLTEALSTDRASLSLAAAPGLRGGPGTRLAPGQRIFHGNYMFGSVPARMIQFTRRSPTFRAVMQDLFSGTQNYIGLKGRLLRNLNGSLFEILGSFGFGRLVPRKDSVA